MSTSKQHSMRGGRASNKHRGGGVYEFIKASDEEQPLATAKSSNNTSIDGIVQVLNEDVSQPWDSSIMHGSVAQQHMLPPNSDMLPAEHTGVDGNWTRMVPSSIQGPDGEMSNLT